VIVWLNGTFGVGKSATAAELARIMPGSRVFDAEIVGYMLMTMLQDLAFSDFQDLPPWRALVPVVTADLQSSGFDVQILPVPYEFQRGGNEMMRISRPAARPSGMR